MILESIVNKSPIVKGWSGDQKYCAVTADGTKVPSSGFVY